MTQSKTWSDFLTVVPDLVPCCLFQFSKLTVLYYRHFNTAVIFYTGIAHITNRN